MRSRSRCALPQRAKCLADNCGGAVVDLQSFCDYAGVLGQTVPAQANMIRVFGAASAWSINRAAALAWEAYASHEAGVAWTGVRAQLARLKPMFLLAAKADPSLLTTYPKLLTLLGARTEQTRKGAATKLANKQAIAEGRPPTHGAVGRRRVRAAQKAALAAAGGRTV